MWCFCPFLAQFSENQSCSNPYQRRPQQHGQRVKMEAPPDAAIDAMRSAIKLASEPAAGRSRRR
jgi:hypothetical protein